MVAIAFKEIEKFSKSDFNKSNYKDIILPNAYKVGGISNKAIGFLFYLSFYGIPFFTAIIVTILVIILFKKLKK